jgi:hypothetical protein
VASRDVDDIDLFPGAMAERPVYGGLVGPTFACILAQQFSNLRKGSTVLYLINDNLFNNHNCYTGIIGQVS